MKRSYLGAVMGEDENYGIVFLDFPGCVSAGDSVTDVIAMGAEALQGHVECMLDAGEAIPDPTTHSVEDVQRWLSEPDDPLEDPIVGLFSIDIVIPEHQETVTMRMKAGLVREIAEIAALQVSRLGSRDFIEQAIEHELERYRKSA
jgi:predicted RNase H-like HicB family nuclease